jgi:hypothetical protein
MHVYFVLARKVRLADGRATSLTGEKTMTLDTLHPRAA